MYGELKREIGIIRRKLCDRKDVMIIEVKECEDSYTFVAHNPKG